MRKHVFSTAILAIALVASGVQAQDAYRLTRDGGTIVIDRDDLWSNWSLQNNRVVSLATRVDSSSIFTVDQGVRARYMRSQINAALNASDFSYFDAVRTAREATGGFTARSNSSRAARIADANLSTYWEPASADFSSDGLRGWEIEIDLGRVVHVDSVTLVFPPGVLGVDGEEDAGDPIKNFALFAGTGERSGGRQGQTDSKILQFDFVSRATDADLVATDDEQYLTYTTSLDPLDDADFDDDGAPDMSGSMVHYFRIKVTGSALGRKVFIGDGEEARLEYEGLSSPRQGDRIYQRVTAGGLLTPVSPEIYESVLNDEERGPIRYYIREVPRLLEFQVWGKGDNIAHSPELRAGASFEQGGWCGLGSTACNATDGALQTWWTANVWSQFVNRGTLWIDLGATFWVDRTAMILKWTSGRTNGSFMGNGFWLSDGSLVSPINLQSVEDFAQLETGVQWDNIIPKIKFDNLDQKVRMFEESFPLRKVRYVMARNVDPTGGEWEGAYVDPGNLSELVLYGEGYPVSVFINSPPILLNDTDDLSAVQQTTLSQISWVGEAVITERDPLTGELTERLEPLVDHPEVSLEIQTRTSQQTDTSFTYYATAGGIAKEVTEQDYNDLLQKWAIYNFVVDNNLDTNHHRKSKDEDGDGQKHEDWFDGIDNDGDGLIDEDWTRVRPGRDVPKEEASRNAVLEFSGWSSWSTAYEPTNGVNEALVTSPSPRKFLQIRVNLRSDDPSKTVRISEIRVELVRPLSQGMAGELAVLTEAGALRDLGEVPIPEDYLPPISVSPLTPHTFSYFIRAAGPDPTQFQVRNGFNEILIRTREPAELLGVRTGTVEVDGAQAMATTFTENFMPGPDGVLRTADGADSLLVIPAGGDSLLFRLPQSLNRGLTGDTQGIVEVRFRAPTSREGTEFESFVRTTGDNFFQRVDIDNRDASELVESSSAQIRLDNSAGGLVHDVQMLPYVTPNGDLVNDELVVAFTLLRVLEDVPVEVSVFDLHGRQIRRMENLEDFVEIVPTDDVVVDEDVVDADEVADTGPALFTRTSGTVKFTWDARDDEGNLVAPGIYILRIHVDTDNEYGDALRTVSVVY